MKKLYQKNELTFALVWIGIYVAGTCAAETLTEIAGVFKLVPAVFHIALAVFAYCWLKRNSLMEKYGLFLPRYPLARAWFFLPLLLVAGYKLFFSPALRYSPMDTLLFIASMLGVGFLEELIFRGFLFRAIEKESLTRAIVISSVTFGIGHIVNLLNGQDPFETFCQVIVAVIIGFALVILFHKGRSLIPCVVFHGLFNSLSVVSNEEAQFRALGGAFSAAVILMVFCAAVLGVWSLWNWKCLKE